MDKNVLERDDTTAPAARRIPLNSLHLSPPGAPAPDIVRDVHRGPDGYVALARKVDGVEWESLGALPVNEPWLPGFLEFVSQDGYFSLNSSFRPARKHERPETARRDTWVPIPGQPGGKQLVSVPVHGQTPTGLPHALHRNNTIRWLNVAHVDLDCYNVGLSVGDTLGQLVTLQDEGAIPPASGFARSGGGVWAFWLLVDTMNPDEGELPVFGALHRPDTPQRATKRAMALYAKVQHALASRLASLGADLGAADAARFAPFPGTRKTLHGQEVVTWWWQATQSGHGYAYTLDQLARALGVALKATAHPVIAAALPHRDRPKNEALSRAGRRGWLARWRAPLGDFRILMNLRGGGFAKGVRNKGAYYYALLMLRSGMAIPDAGQHVAEFAAACQPQLSEQEQKQAMRQALRDRPQGTGFVSYRRLFNELGVTLKEASYLEHIRPDAADAAEAPVTPTRTPKAERQRVIVELLDGLDHVPATRTMSQYLEGRGVVANWTTISRDYQELGLLAARAKGGRPAKLFPN